MIPKIIHYCWFSGDDLPEQAQKCIKSWQKWLPDYEIKKWTLNDFDVNTVRLTKESLGSRKWAFLTDYVRHYALFNYGGVYLDSDVMLYGDLNKILDADYVSACEYHPTYDQKIRNKKERRINDSGKRIGDSLEVLSIGVQAAVLASVPRHPLSKRILDFYQDLDLESILKNNYLAPTVIAYNMEQCGFLYIDKEQNLKEGIHLYPTQIISHYTQKNKKSIAVHWCAGSWVEKSFSEQIRRKMNNYTLYRWLKEFFKRIYIR